MSKDTTLRVYKSALPQLALEETTVFKLAYKKAWTDLVPHISSWYAIHEGHGRWYRQTHAESFALRPLLEYLVKVAVRDAPLRKKFLDSPGALYRNNFFKSKAYLDFESSAEVAEVLEALENPETTIELPKEAVDQFGSVFLQTDRRCAIYWLFYCFQPLRALYVAPSYLLHACTGSRKSRNS